MVINMSAVALHDALVHYLSGGNPDEWIEIVTVKVVDLGSTDKEQRKRTFRIRPDATRCRDLSYVMADDIELIPCLEIDGNKVDVIMPPTAWKQDRPAEIRLSHKLPDEEPDSNTS